MDEKKNAIKHMMAEIECYPIFEDDAAMKEYTKMPIGEFSALGAAFASMLPAFRQVTQNVTLGSGEPLYRMVIPNGISAGEKLVEAKSGGLLGNVTNANGVITQRARYFEVGPQTGTVSTVMPVNPATMLMAVAIAAISKKLDRIEEAQKDIIDFLRLKEKAVLKGNVAVLQEILDEYKYNWDNEKYKNNKHIQVQEIKRDAEQSIIFCREQIEKTASRKGLLHSDRDVKSKIQKVQYEFKDYELSMFIYSFASFLEIMLLENFDAGYLNSVTGKIEQYAEQYHELHEKCYEMIDEDSKTSVQAYALKGIAGINKALGKAIAKIPKISDGQADEKLIATGEKVQDFSDRRTADTMELFAHERCTCVSPFIDNINAVNRIYNEPLEVYFDCENIYFDLANSKMPPQ